MRFMMVMMPEVYSNPKWTPTYDPKDFDAMMKFNEELKKAGVLLSIDGLRPPSEGARVAFSGGKPKVIDGPFAEAKEVIGGFWIIECKSRDEALAWATKVPARDGDVIEVRQVQDLADFPEPMQKALTEKYRDVEQLSSEFKARK